MYQFKVYTTRGVKGVRAMRHRVVVLALDGLLPFELGIPQRIFGRRASAEAGDRAGICTRS